MKKEFKSDRSDKVIPVQGDVLYLHTKYDMVNDSITPDFICVFNKVCVHDIEQKSFSALMYVALCVSTKKIYKDTSVDDFVSSSRFATKKEKKMLLDHLIKYGYFTEKERRESYASITKDGCVWTSDIGDETDNWRWENGLYFSSFEQAIVMKSLLS